MAVRVSAAASKNGRHSRALPIICYGKGSDVTQARQVICETEDALANGFTNFMVDMGRTVTVNEYDFYALARVAALMQNEHGFKLKLLNPSPTIRKKLLQQDLIFTDFYHDK